jgi:hypothetical protein
LKLLLTAAAATTTTTTTPTTTIMNTTTTTITTTSTATHVTYCVFSQLMYSQSGISYGGYTLTSLRRREENNIKLDLNKIGLEGVEWM